MITNILTIEMLLNVVLIIINVYIVVKAYSTKNKSLTSSEFFRFSFSNLIFVLAFTLNSLYRGGVIPRNSILAYFVYLFLLVALCAVSYFWFVFIEESIFSKWANTKQKRFLWSIPLIVYTILCITSYWTGWIFIIDSNGEYQLGTYYILQYVICFGYCIITMVRTSMNFFIKKSKNRTDIILFFSMFLVLFAVVLQLLLQTNMMPPAITLMLLISYFEIYAAELLKITNAERRAKEQEQEKISEQLMHEKLHADVLTYMINHKEEDPVELLKVYAERLRSLINCDQVIYRDLEEVRIMVNSPEIENTWAVPLEYCQQCAHLDPHHHMYRNGFTEMENCQEGFEGIPVYHKCPIKSSLTRIIYCDGEVAGYLAIHYVQNYHKFTDMERSTLEEFTRILSVSLSRYRASQENKELKEREELLEKLAEQNSFTSYLLGPYESAYYVSLVDKSCKIYTRTTELEDTFPIDDDYVASLSEYIEKAVVEEDRENLSILNRPNDVRKKLSTQKSFNINFREVIDDTEKQIRCEVIRGADEDHIAFGFKDITEEERIRIEYQKQLEEARNTAESANKSKTAFLFNMSHDIRTPMNAIKGFTAMAKKYANDEERVKDYLEKIDISSYQLITLINQVLEMSRIESGKIEFVEEPIDVIERVESIVTIVKSQAEAKGLEFGYSVDIDHTKVLADDSRMGQITLNILSNAIKYTPEGGNIEFKLKEMKPRKPGYATFLMSCKDTGIGMSEEYQKELFEPFTREKTSTVSNIQGTGLGMTIVKNLVDLLGGNIEVKSKLNKGTEFILTIDLKIDESKENKGAKDIDISAISFEGKRVLLVEDNEMNREIAKDILEEYGFIVEEADDGDVAVDIVKECIAQEKYDYFDFILMDIQMPKLNGYDATRQIRSIPSRKVIHIPIIAMTANAFAEDRKNALLAGMDDHLAKPINIKDLISTLAKYL